MITNFISQILFENLSQQIKVEVWSLLNLYTVLSSLVTTFYFWCALISFCLSSILWIFAIRRIALSIAFSMMSLNYVLIIAYTFFFLNEYISINQLISCTLIIAGVLIISNNQILTKYFKSK